MIIDFLKTDRQNHTLHCDVCIIGSGPAGISIALEFINSPTKVIVLESGGWNFESSTQSLYKGDMAGVAMPYPLDGSRSRIFGGGSNCWAGSCAYLDKIVFEKRPWISNSGWPISKQDLMPYYKRASELMQIDAELREKRLQRELPILNIPFLPGTIKTGYRYTSLMQWGGLVREYRKVLEKSQNIKIYLHANLTELKANEKANYVKHAQIKSLSGKSGQVKSKLFIVACGGIENARILLYSNSVASVGLGNENDLVGRYFMDHIVAPAATVFLKTNGKKGSLKKESSLMKFFHQFESYTSLSYFILSDELQRKEKLLNVGAYLLKHPLEFGDALRAAVRLRSAYKNGIIPKSIFSDLWSVIKNIDEVAPAVYNRIYGGKTSENRLAIKVQTEQEPNPLSRVTLSRERDQLGLNQTVLNWKHSRTDRKSFEFMVQALAVEFGRLDIARVKYDKWINESAILFPDDIRGGQHHSGTTRMTDSPQNGVVDKNCRVHSVENLYVAGSSVFPTTGWDFPTFTISALAIRLADFIKKKLT